MTGLNRTWLMRGGAVVAGGALLLGAWSMLGPKGPGEGLVSGNGRTEATEVDIAAKNPGRLTEVRVDEGDAVKAGQVLAVMDTQGLAAQRAEAQAGLQAALSAVQAAQSQVRMQESQQAALLAGVRQRETELASAGKHLARSQTLAEAGAAANQEREDDQARSQSLEAALAAADDQVAGAEAAVAAARAQATAAAEQVTAAEARVRRLDVEIADATLTAPQDGRVQYRIAQPGEVLGGGGKVLNLVDLTEVHMTFFLPETAAGRVGLGAEARIVLDAAPDLVIPARISYVADVAQFTPKTVETKSERQKLMFRVKARIDPAVLRAHLDQVKTGLPGVAYVRIDPHAAWPASLALKPAR